MSGGTRRRSAPPCPRAVGGRVTPPNPLTCWGVCTYSEGEGTEGKKTVIVRSPRHAANCGRSSAVFGRGCGFAVWGAPLLKQANPFSACTGPCPILVPPGEPRPPKRAATPMFSRKEEEVPRLSFPESQGSVPPSLNRGRWSLVRVGDGTRGPLIFTGRSHRSSGAKPRTGVTFLSHQ